jgi:hypothetical protein
MDSRCWWVNGIFVNYPQMASLRAGRQTDNIIRGLRLRWNHHRLGPDDQLNTRDDIQTTHNSINDEFNRSDKDCKPRMRTLGFSDMTTATESEDYNRRERAKRKEGDQELKQQADVLPCDPRRW